MFKCFACAARDGTAHSRAKALGKDSPPPAGEYIVVREGDVD